MTMTDTEIEALMERCERAEAAAIRYRAVLEAMEFEDLDGLGSMASVEVARQLGTVSRLITVNAIDYRDYLMDKYATPEENVEWAQKLVDALNRL